MDVDLDRAISRIPCGLFILTAAFDGTRSGVLVEWVQQCASCPPMVMTALATALPIVPLIRDSRGFALCQIGADDRFLPKKFASTPEPGEDPFVTLSTITAPSGSPIVERAVSYLDCELVRHIDLESDHGLYVGRVRDAGILTDGAPAVVVGEEGTEGLRD
ncbi:MAG: flavin reductase family protein [Planctomycetota bacterium]|jgi:flavin reductase (DIM6/NTAB) family NADH-FMN oxidoreductase RutF